jgi:peptide/nickel transport system substrate-binding protein
MLFLGVLAACVPAAPVEPEEPEVEEPEVEEPEVEEPEVEEPEVEEPEVEEPEFEPQPYGENLPTEPTITTPLVVAYTEFSNKFSPFFSESGYDADVVAFTQINLLTTDRVGGIVSNAIEGETRNYNGTDYLYKGPADTSVVYDEESDTTKYTARLRVGMVFSDGVPVTADDVIFSYYTLLDPTYVGTSSLSSYDILGLKDYQTQTTSEVFDKYDAMFDAIFAARPDHEWTEEDSWTQEQQDDLWEKFDTRITKEAQKIVDYVVANYGDYALDYTGYAFEEIEGVEGMEVMLGMVLWGFGSTGDDGSFTTGCTEETFDLVETFPTVQTYVDDIIACYEWDMEAAFPYESTDGAEVLAPTKTDFIGYWGPLDESMGDEGVPNIAGIKKLDDYTVEVTVAGFSAPAVYSILGIDVAPLHYYGDAAKYDYENNMFGFDYGDLSSQQEVTPYPMGAGEYKFVEYENKVVYFEANPLYYKGSPKIAEVQFKETESNEVPSAVQTGTADAGEMTYSAERYAEVKSYNSNGEMTGDVITSSMVDNLGYGYIGINAGTVNVGGEPGSDASKNLRKALATIIAVHRDLSVDSYYGEGASVINYPISNTSWAAPQPTDEDYRIAYSVDVNGDPIYTADMTLEEKVAAAEAAALGFLEAAGYTVVDGKVTEAPEGAKLSYEGYVPADGIGDHPNFGIFTSTQESCANIGLEFLINDPADWNVMLDAIDAEEQEIWTMAWGTTIDPDMYQIYHSSNVPGGEGTGSNYYHVTDEQLDQLILDARKSDDQAYRKAVYKQALEVLMDWAVEVPSYQRLNVIIFSTDRIVIDSITPDITTFWGWASDIEMLEMAQ